MNLLAGSGIIKAANAVDRKKLMESEDKNYVSNAEDVKQRESVPEMKPDTASEEVDDKPEGVPEDKVEDNDEVP